MVQEQILLKRFLIWSSAGPPVWWSRTIYANLKEGIMGNIHVKLYEIRTSGSGRDVVKENFTDGRKDGQRPITIFHLEPSAQMS